MTPHGRTTLSSRIFAALTITPVLAGITAHASEWIAPIGVPYPEFGIVETVESVYGSEDYYTHFVQNNHPAATDTSNPYGTPTKPRRSVPSSLPAGSVVYVNGGSYSAGSMCTITGNGTSGAPVFLRGNRQNMPVFELETAFKGTYFIIEGVDFNGSAAQANVLGPSHHIAIRHCEVRNAGGNGAGFCAVGSWDSADPTLVTDIVFYDNYIHDLGDLSATSDQDHHGFVIGHHANRVWVVDNEVCYTSGSGLQVNSGFLDETGDRPAHHVYIGRNYVHHVRQSGLACKKARDIVFSQNVVHDVITTSWSTSKGLAYQYGPYNIWFLFNHVYDCTWGANGPGNTGGPGGTVYFIGNVIHNCDWGLLFWDHDQVVRVLANTITNVESGVSYENGPGIHLRNNILAEMGGGPHLRVSGSSGTTAANSTSSHDLFHQSAGSICIDWGSGHYLTVADFQAGTGKGALDVEADPRFLNGAGRNYRLQATSPAVDDGIMPSAYTTYELLYGETIRVDFDGLPRPAGAAHDLGSFELLQLSADDFPGMAVCLSGPDADATADCAPYDLHRDGAVDLADYAVFQASVMAP